MAHVEQNEFKILNWLPISHRTDQSVLLTTFKFVNGMGPNLSMAWVHICQWHGFKFVNGMAPNLSMAWVQIT